MALTDYTSFEEIRSTLGVSSEELDNSVLALDVNLYDLEESLHDINPSLISTYEGISLKEDSSRSSGEARVYRLTKLFATYSVARRLATALPMFSPRTISDGKASFSRFSGEPYKDVLKGIEDMYDLYRGRLVAALEDLLADQQAPTVERTYFVPVGLAYDPVTGE